MSSDDDESHDTGHNSTTPRRRPHCNRAIRSKRDPVWRYFEDCDAPTTCNDPNRRYLRCKFCNNFRTYHATRAKMHLWGNICRQDAPPCERFYNHVPLDEINMIYNVIKVHPRVKYKNPDGSHNLVDGRGCITIFGGVGNSQVSMRDSNHFPPEDDTTTHDRSRARSRSNPVMDAYQIPNRHMLNKKWSRAFFTSGMAFNVANNPCFREAVRETAKGLVNGYELPTMKDLRCELLVEGREDITKDMTKIMKEAKPYGYSLSSDGWENVRREPLMNAMLLTCKGDFFLDSWNAAQADRKDAKYLGEKWLKYIDEVGPDHVVQVVTDGAAANRAAGQGIVMTKYPHLTWSWCAAHVFDLLLEDICGSKKTVVNEHRRNPFKDIFIRLRWIVKVVSKSQKLQSIFVRKSPGKALLNPNATRFATHFCMAQRALELRGPLQQMVIDDRWQSYHDRLPVHPKSAGHMTRDKALELKVAIQNDAFWAQVKAAVNFFIPLVKMLREFDGSSPQSPWLYWSLKNGYSKLEASMEKCPLVTEYLKPCIRKVYMDRKKSLTTDFMLAAAYLNPRMFFDEDVDVAGDQELHRGFRSYLARYAKHKVKQEINHDREVEALISDIQRQALEAQQKLPNTSVTCSGAQTNIDNLSPGEWWHQYGADYKDLRILARKITHQKMCASACERNWSSYGFIHSKSRNRLTNNRAKDLVFVFTNTRVQEGLTKVRNPHAAIYKRYDERRIENDVRRPLPMVLSDNEEYDATLASTEEEDVEDFDNIDDADEALQGLSLDNDNGILARIPPDSDNSDWDWEA